MTSDSCIFFRKPKAAKNIRKRKKVDSDEEVSGDDIPYSGPATKKSAGLSFSSSSSGVGSLFQFDSSKEIQVKHDSRATATLETETEFSKDARAIRDGQPFEDPVVTKRKHYFCEHCALKTLHLGVDIWVFSAAEERMTCYICGAVTFRYELH
ncbi:hypothetical protein ZIOFF_070994 [Zingiber officinale]|uniref:Uncharacterized protein n=1 Tax=Zingiber officinale TaxID=94328 RepID=A0A8J5C0Y5_ZINOF|nr:hypothetical protein ZIOFF_070994 [Zingiber officinale]